MSSESDREDVHLTRLQTVLGSLAVASTSKGLLACTLPGRDRREITRRIAKHLPQARVVEGVGRNANAVEAVQQFLAGRRRDLDLPLDLRGTPFQLAVWSALREVGYGETVSYAELARRAGHPSAMRACGAANGANPLPLFVPCHRVVASDGSLGGFTGGLPLKRALLAIESPGLFDGI